MIIEKLWEFGPSFAPEWGSGGIFGLKYHKGVLYFTLAFDGKSFFISDSREFIYNFEQLGAGPSSGGDTYNAVDVRDHEIFFGGWVHKPVRWIEKSRRRVIDFSKKFSHIHVFNIREWSVQLLWNESLNDPEKWCGEVTDIIYNPVRDSLLIARGDGFERLGVYELDLSSKKMLALSNKTAVKGATVGDTVCFDVSGGLDEGVLGIQCFDVNNLKKTFEIELDDFSKISVDGGNVRRRGSGYAVSAYSHYLHFVRGGLLIANPESEEIHFVRLLDFGNARYSQPTPQRSSAVIVGGGVLAPFSSYSHSDIANPLPSLAPSLLLYLAPPLVKISGILGARITSGTKFGERILLGYSTHPNTVGPQATLLESGRRGILALHEESLVLGGSPPTVLRFRGVDIEKEHFGGVPLIGFKKRLLKISAKKLNKLTIYEYDVGVPPQLISIESYSIKNDGKEEIDLSGFGPVVSFKLEVEDQRLSIHLILE
ncbi:MAG: DUF2139 domain-containing protein [Acidilobaceae archaeon]